MFLVMRNINYSFLPPGSLPSSRSIPFEKEVVGESDTDRLLKLVYALDERTKLPSSDLSILASDSVPPEIAEFVRTQLLNPIDCGVSSIKNGEQIDDDTLLALTRNSRETPLEYVTRVNNYLVDINKSSEGD